MPTILTPATGTVVLVPSTGVTASLFFVRADGSNLTAQILKVLIQSVGIQEEVIAQFSNTLQNFTYVYVFGDSPAQLIINGIAYASECQSLNTDHGFDSLMAYYRRNRASSRAAPLTITIGKSTSYTGYLIGAKASVADPATGLCQFSLMFVCPSLGR